MRPPRAAWFRAVDVDAPAPVVFRWLCQLRAAPYSYDLVDNFGRRSPRSLTPGLETLTVGDRFMTIFDLVAFDPGRHVTLAARRGPFGELAVTYLVIPCESTGSRLVVKVLVGGAHPGRRAAVRRQVMPWADLLMMRRQLQTLRGLAERSAPVRG